MALGEAGSAGGEGTEGKEEEDLPSSLPNIERDSSIDDLGPGEVYL
jgi:hypothetical protein